VNAAKALQLLVGELARIGPATESRRREVLREGLDALPRDDAAYSSQTEARWADPLRAWFEQALAELPAATEGSR
jgi:hypothetical protein